jgi:hypothetical protein
MDLDQRMDMVERTRQLLTSPFAMMAMAAMSSALVTAMMIKLLQ